MLAFFKVLLEIFRNKLYLYLYKNIDIQIILKFYNHLLNLPIDFFNKKKVGDVI
ncbi:ABC transporter transmembrane domain-containing protein [Clostridium gasigenes]|uniref:ABC transporter transmembrane domain-containing protein n=1 Tax=Clostridium gasigenes TaxID=94869 RepID=UPI003399725B